jgi:hypothetical protein
LGDLRVIERASAYEYEMRPRFRAAEHGRAASRAKHSMHDVAALGDIRIVAGYAVDDEILGLEAGIDRAAPGAQILAQAAPANARNDRRICALETYRAAQTTPGYFHPTPPADSPPRL